MTRKCVWAGLIAGGALVELATNQNWWHLWDAAYFCAAGLFIHWCFNREEKQ